MRTNSQEKLPVLNQPDHLIVQEIFLSLQGEGPRVGQPAVFVRLAGCNIQCPMCDTDYTTEAEVMSIAEVVAKIVALIGNNKVHLVVITGGEPFRQPDGVFSLVTSLNSRAPSYYDIQIETNGTLPPPREFLHWKYPTPEIVCSPKLPKVNKKLFPILTALKYVVDSEGAGTQAAIDSRAGIPVAALGLVTFKGKVQMSLPIPEGCHTIPVYLTPADEQEEEANKRNIDLTVKLCLQYGHTFCFQVHKAIGIR